MFLVFVFIALTLGPMLAVAAAIAMWLALGDAKLMWRFIFAFFCSSLLGLAFCTVIGELEAEWLALMWIVVVTVGAMFLTVRWHGLRLIDTTKSPRMDVEEFQFSISHLLGLTGAVALIASVARALAPLVATRNALLAGFGIAICLGSLAIIVSLTTLRQRRPENEVRIFAIATSAFAFVVYAVMEATDVDPGIVWGSVVVVYALSFRRLLSYFSKRGFALVSYAARASIGP